ncbi:hypothetical protein FSPOR_3004 [Fusarium sporotrichioides]|uniref:Uncharacterized protein n=1 Tax=Fusarium sporotrichioides TaxID=5514 RepID=A0A395SIJ5_FUSSP|nr:hypothetical protein FSPOR_3004 [Fusarium sporotrichioides]
MRFPLPTSAEDDGFGKVHTSPTSATFRILEVKFPPDIEIAYREASQEDTAMCHKLSMLKAKTLTQLDSIRGHEFQVTFRHQTDDSQVTAVTQSLAQQVPWTIKASNDTADEELPVKVNLSQRIPESLASEL